MGEASQESLKFDSKTCIDSGWSSFMGWFNGHIELSMYRYTLDALCRYFSERGYPFIEPTQCILNENTEDKELMLMWDTGKTYMDIRLRTSGVFDWLYIQRNGTFPEGHGQDDVTVRTCGRGFVRFWRETRAELLARRARKPFAMLDVTCKATKAFQYKHECEYPDGWREEWHEDISGNGDYRLRNSHGVTIRDGWYAVLVGESWCGYAPCDFHNTFDATEHI